MYATTRHAVASAVVCLLAVTPTLGTVALELDVPELTGTFIHGQSPISAIVDFQIDFELAPDLIIEVTGTGTPGVSSTSGVFPADLVVTVNHIFGGEFIPPTVLGPYGETPVLHAADNTPGDISGDLDGGLVGVLPAQFQVIISSNPEHTGVTTPSTVDISNVKLLLIEHQPSCLGGGDGFVGITDLNIVLGNWNQNVTPGDCLQGDHSGDGYIGIEDLNAVLGNWNAGTPPSESDAVPEPAAVTCMGIGLTCLLYRSRR